MSHQNDYALVRIIGNDLAPRVAKGNSYENLKFIIENEYPFENTSKYFILNRIQDRNQLSKMVSLLDETPFEYVVIDSNKYSKSMSESEKIKQLININSVRNLTLEMFKFNHEIVLPLDGGCFFRLDGWMRLCSSIEEGKGYAVIQVGRCNSEYPNSHSSGIQPWFEYYRHGGRLIQAATEPQIGFISKEYDLNFDENIIDLDQSKIDLLFKIGVRGVWDDIFFHKRMNALLSGKSKFYGKSCQGGWCYRLPSGIPEPMDNQVRAELKNQAIRGLIENADRIYSD